MTIRPASVPDAEGLAPLVVQLGYSGSAEDVARRLASLDEDHAVLVADDDGRLAGFVHVRIERTIESEPYGEIRGLVVDQRHRSSGIGRSLLDAAEGWIRARRLGRVRVRSNVTRDRARKFYEREGYRVTKVSNVFEKEL